MKKPLAIVFKDGDKQAISIDESVLKEAHLQIGDTLEIRVENGKLLLTKIEKPIKDEIQDFYRNGGCYTENEIN